jgi:hypothetical protein
MDRQKAAFGAFPARGAGVRWSRNLLLNMRCQLGGRFAEGRLPSKNRDCQSDCVGVPKEEGLFVKGYRTVLVIAFALIVGGVYSAQAAHKDVKHCADDYRKFCHQWGLETKGLENCMHKHGDKLTNACIAALVKSGNVSQAEVNRRKAALGR